MRRFSLGFLEVLNTYQLTRIGTNIGAFDYAYALLNDRTELVLSIYENPFTLDVETVRPNLFKATYSDQIGQGSTPDLAIFEAVYNSA